jgi:type II secretory pathway pseudopilin PulG
MNKDHQLDAYFATPESVKPKPNETRISSTLAVSAKSSPSYSNFNAEIDGFLTANGASLANVPILLSYSVTGGKSWVDLTLVNTNDKGVFSATWTPDVTGDYLIKATWDGDSTYSDATTIINFAITVSEKESVFSVTSNSTLTQLAFDSNRSLLSFSVSGPSGTTGYVNLYVPKTLIADTSTLKVYLDMNQLPYTVQPDGDSWIILFNYTHSTHDVTVDLTGKTATEATNNNPENLLIYAIPITAVILALIVALVILKKRKKP